jgi:hypothetical protein
MASATAAKVAYAATPEMNAAARAHTAAEMAAATTAEMATTTAAAAVTAAAPSASRIGRARKQGRQHDNRKEIEF